MKVISGILKGRIIKGFDIEGTRPTMDRVKESLFASIQNYVRDSTVLDLFAGSGSLGIEAISNGASMCYFNDKNIKCTNIIKENLKKFNVEDSAKVLSLDYKMCLKYLKENNITFDIILLDPPYKDRTLIDIAKYIYDNNMLNKNGIIVFEVDDLYVNLDFYLEIKNKKYGDKYIIIYKN